MPPTSVGLHDQIPPVVTPPRIRALAALSATTLAAPELERLTEPVKLFPGSSG
jgi:hypothetical protein